jgi:hypothetical protein
LLFVLFAGLTTNVLICFAGQTLTLPLIDPWLAAADQLLGLGVVSFIEACISIPGFTGLLGLAYLSSFPLLLGSVLFLGISGRAVAAWTLVSVFTMCLLVTVCGSVVLPAEGAFHFLGLTEELRAALPPGSGTYHLQTLFALRGADQLIVDPTNLQGVATLSLVPHRPGADDRRGLARSARRLPADDRLASGGNRLHHPDRRPLFRGPRRRGAVLGQCAGYLPPRCGVPAGC